MTAQDEINALVRPDLRRRSAYGAPQLDVPVQLNTNENSYPVPSVVVEAMTEALTKAAPNLNRYPDREFTELRDALADYVAGATGVDVCADQVWAGNGSNESLLHVVQAFGGAGRTALGFTPSYAMYPNYCLTTGTTWVDGRRGDRFDLTVDGAVEQVAQVKPDLIFLCSPNNPTGTALDLDVVRAVYDAAPRAVIVVDEAYGEFARTGTPSALTLLEGRPRLVVSRTMSKAFALAGGRLGYLVADPALVDALRLVRMPYHLSTPSQVVARAALAHADVLQQEVEVLRQQRDRIVSELVAMGLDPAPSDANFVFFGGLEDAAATWAALLERGVLVRDVGIPGHLRVTAGTPAETTAFLDALRAVLAATSAPHLTSTSLQEQP